jgi:alpha-1,3-rhamnosyl/mannosyltransferase
MPVLEAMATGVPVLASNRGALIEAGGAAARLFDPDDPEALSRALAELLTDETGRRRMSEAGLAHARQFTWARTAARMREGWRAAVEYHAGRRG